jgi:hypothetical protein
LLRPIEETGDPAFMHDHDAVAHAENLGHLRRDHHHGDAPARDFGDEAVDFCLGADIDAARRFVEDEDLRIGQQPAADQRLLLVAARQVLDPLVADWASSRAACFAIASQASSMTLSCTKPALTNLSCRHRDLHVLEDVEDQKTAGILAILGEKRHAGWDRNRRRLDVDLLAEELDRPGACRRHTEHVSATFERPEPTRPATPRISPARTSNETSRKTAFSSEVFDRQDDVADRHLFLRKHLGDFAADHHADDVVAGDVSRCMRADIRPSRNTENSSAISNSSFILWVM